MSRLLITGSRNHQWTPYDSQALPIAVREILEKPMNSLFSSMVAQQEQTPKLLAWDNSS